MELKWQQKPQIRIIISRKSVRKEKRRWLRPEPQRPHVQKGQRASNVEEALSSQQGKPGARLQCQLWPLGGEALGEHQSSRSWGPGSPAEGSVLESGHEDSFKEEEKMWDVSYGEMQGLGGRKVGGPMSVPLREW